MNTAIEPNYLEVLTEEQRDHYYRLEAMIDDDGGLTWDLSDNDLNAISFGLDVIRLHCINEYAKRKAQNTSDGVPA